MDLISKHTQLRYLGYANTPVLWNDDNVLGLRQFKPLMQVAGSLGKNVPENLPLGKLVERFVTADLEKLNDIEILLENTQVQDGKLTIGELDCILKQDSIPIHLEIIYKFYLYDGTVGSTEIDHWIGPNRNDTLVKKIDKLKNKQLPLLYHICTKPILDRHQLVIERMHQSVCFKAQLFIPFDQQVNFKELNKDCLKGYYIHYSEINKYSDCSFYIPIKVDWLQEVHSQVDWLTYPLFYDKVMRQVQEKRASLCWIKFPDGNLQKIFIVWWS